MWKVAVDGQICRRHVNQLLIRTWLTKEESLMAYSVASAQQDARSTPSKKKETEIPPSILVVTCEMARGLLAALVDNSNRKWCQTQAVREAG